MEKIPVGILGACGMVGMQLVHLLSDHPYFELTHVAGSKRTLGKRYSDAANDRWSHSSLPPTMIIERIENLALAKKRCKIIFSAVSNELSEVWDDRYAEAGFAVISLSSAHRKEKDIPMIIPEINPDHLKIVQAQQKRRGWSGFIVTKPNCSLQSFLLPLFPLHKKFRLKKVSVTMLQAMSGAGFSGKCDEIEDNIFPHIPNEEDKTQIEPLKIFGEVTSDGIIPLDDVKISAQCFRVPVTDGHLASVSVSFKIKPTQNEIFNAWNSCIPLPQELKLPMAPSPLLIYQEGNRPQPYLDRDAGRGMAVTLGRLRPCSILDWRFVALSHNLIRGAAGGALLTAELLYKRGFYHHAKAQPDLCLLER